MSFFFENRALYEKIWKNIAEPGRPQMTVWRKCIACLYPRLQTHALTKCNTFVSTQQKQLQ